ncbi:MAG: hypothetical protein WCG09_02400 [Halobacteriota archaeon]
MSASYMGHMIWKEKELKHRARRGRGKYPPMYRGIIQYVEYGDANPHSYYEPRQEDDYHLPKWCLDEIAAGRMRVRK